MVIQDYLDFNELKEGEFVLVVGGSGSGKSSLLKSLAGEGCSFVLQNPDEMILTDKVWHELAFGLESEGYDSNKIRLRVGETADRFGITDFFDWDTNKLSGGQKQIVSLAAAMITHPRALILDEPLSCLDPASEEGFLSALKRIHEKEDTIIIIAEHKIDELMPLATRLVNLSPKREYKTTIQKVFFALNKGGTPPNTLREARLWLKDYVRDNPPNYPAQRISNPKHSKEVLSVKELWYKYIDNDFTLRGLSICLGKGEICGLIGGNGSGKTTLLKCIAAILKPTRGKVITDGKLGYMPQNPRIILAENAFNDEQILNLSEGQLHFLALEKVSETGADILLLDEPTKGMDEARKDDLIKKLKDLANRGCSILLVTHDTEFCAKSCDRVSLLFKGEILANGTPPEVFTETDFYTTNAARLARGILDNVLTAEDIIARWQR